MKVIKRDGKAVDYNREKIEIAIEKANNEVKQGEKATKQEIKEITKYIENLDKKRMLVEDIQDIIEEQLMDRKKFELAKKYMIYRYTRALVRKQNTTDESILGLIKNQNRNIQNEERNSSLVAKQRDYIAGEVSKDLSMRILLPEKIAKAHEENNIYFHNMEYFIEPIFNSSVINLEDMLDNGTVINEIAIDTPETYAMACNILMQIIEQTSSSQCGMQTIDVKALGKYVRKSHNSIRKMLEEEFQNELSKDVKEKLTMQRLKKEITSGIQMLEYQINTLITSNGSTPNVALFINLEKDDEYLEENKLIVEEILKRRYKGIKSKTGEYITAEFPKLIYVLNEDNSLNGGELDYLTKMAIESAKKRGAPYFLSSKNLKENYCGKVIPPAGFIDFLEPYKDEEGKCVHCGRFNQGKITINLPQIAIIADSDESKFWSLLDERLETCKDALMCIHYLLLGTLSRISPIDWNYGAISRLDKDENIDKLLKNGYSSLSLGYVGIDETAKLIKNASILEKEGHDFSIKLLKYLNDKIKEWKRETSLGFVLCQTLDKNVCESFIKYDREEYGEITGITDKDAYTNSFYINNEEKDVIKKMEFENEYQKLTPGGSITYLKLEDIDNFEDVIKYIYENTQYVGFQE